MKIKEKIVLEYWSDDGHVFDNEEKCRRYEKSIKAMDSVEKLPSKYVGHLSESIDYICEMEPEFWYKVSSNKDLENLILSYPGNDISESMLRERCNDSYPLWVGIHNESALFRHNEYSYVDYEKYKKDIELISGSIPTINE